MPSDHKRVVASYHCADAAVTREAIAAALAAKEKWEALPSEDRASVFLKAADLLSTKYRAKVCAASMLGASKNVWQAEIDAAGARLCARRGRRRQRSG
jgi:1-pyrroline-5-carboxylate dehydrogenase